MIVIRFLFGMGEAGAFPDRHAVAFALDAAGRARIRAGSHARRFAAGRGADAAAGGAADHHALRLARGVLDVSAVIGLVWAAAWFFYYRDTPEEHAGVNPAERDLIHSATGGARPRADRTVPWRRILSSSDAVVSGRDVFLLQLLPLDVSRLVSDLPQRLSRITV